MHHTCYHPSPMHQYTREAGDVHRNSLPFGFKFKNENGFREFFLFSSIHNIHQYGLKIVSKVPRMPR